MVAAVAIAIVAIVVTKLDVSTNRIFEGRSPFWGFVLFVFNRIQPREELGASWHVDFSEQVNFVLSALFARFCGRIAASF